MKRKSLIWKVEKQVLERIVAESSSISSILRKLGFENKGGNYKTLKQRLNEDVIDYSHINLGLNSNSGRKFLNSKKIPLSEILTEKSSYNRGHLKNRLWKENLLEKKCSECGLEDFWNGKPITLQLDHINGVSDDNRIENLRILCPNCHSQTDSFAGKRFKYSLTNKLKSNKDFCGCGNVKHKKGKQCKECNSFTQRKVVRPTKEVLVVELAESNYCAMGRKYGVTDNTIRKWIK